MVDAPGPDDAVGHVPNAAQPLAPIDLGPVLWRTWHADQQGETGAHGQEYLLYTDAHITARSEALTFGPLAIQPAIGSLTQETMAARIVVRLWEAGKAVEAPRPDAEPAAPHDYWLMLDAAMEIAALISLGLGIRVQSGGPIRRYSTENLAGRTDTLEHHVPTLLRSAYHRRAMITGIAGTVMLDDVAERLDSYFGLSGRDAVLLVRAAAAYSDALWVADYDPELAWLNLITALELAADQHNDRRGDAVALLEAWNPKLFSFLRKRDDEPLLRGVADRLRELIGVWRKVEGLIRTFPPGAPGVRSESQWANVEWSDIDAICNRVKVIYGHRSKRLHGGIHFPAVLLRPPIIDHAEIPTPPLGDPELIASFAGLVGWKHREAPLTFEAFAHLTRSCLLRWWDGLDTST